MALKHALSAFLPAIVCAATLTAQAPAGNQTIQMPMGQMPMGEMGGMQMGQASKAAPAAGPLKITYGDKSAEYTAAQLAPMPQTAVSAFNSHAKAHETYTGVPLIDLLAKLGVPDKPDGKQFLMYLVAEGSDGYGVVYSLGEVAPDVHDASVIVADTENGMPLADDGPLKLVDSRERRPARWVRNLVAVKVMTAE